MPEDPYAISEEERTELLEWIASLKVPKAVQKTLARGCDLELIQDGWCTKCGGRVPARYPDLRGMEKFINLLLKYKVPLPALTTQTDINVRVIHAREELEALSDAELLELAGVEDAEWQPLQLPPAA